MLQYVHENEAVDGCGKNFGKSMVFKWFCSKNLTNFLNFSLLNTKKAMRRMVAWLYSAQKARKQIWALLGQQAMSLSNAGEGRIAFACQ
ncbi:MAG: hypothetical protein ACK4NS_09130 [Saprospiraceae bacterium]